MDFLPTGGMSMPMTMPSFGLGPDPSFPDLVPHKRIIGIDITFTSAGKPPIRRSFLRSEFKAVHLGREPAEISGVANAFARTDVVPPVMSRKHAEIMFSQDAPEVVDIGSYHGTYFQGIGQRLVPNKPYLLWDGSVLEFGKSVTKDDKAHEPLMATIKFIHESDRVGRLVRESSGLFSPASPPRRYGVPSDSEDEDEEVDDEDEDDDSNSSASGSRSGSDVFEYTPEGVHRAHIDLTGMSDDDAAHKFGYTEDARDGIECLGFGYAPKNTYHEESSSDMSESEYEDEPVLQRIVEGASVPVHLQDALGDFGAHVYPEHPDAAPVQFEAAPVHFEVAPEPRGLEVTRGGDDGPSEEVRTLKAELAVAQNEISELKRSLEQERDKDGDVPIVEREQVLDVPSRIASIESMIQQLATVGDGEICEYRTAVQEMLGQLSAGVQALRVRVGVPTSPGNNKRKRTDEDEEEEVLVVESRRAQSPLPMASVSTQATPPMTVAPPAKRSRFAASTLGVFAGGAAVWGALALDLI